MVTNRDTARATTPSALPNGFSVNSSPCATAAITGADAWVRAVTMLASSSSRGPTSLSARGRPSRSWSTWSAAASMCRRANACNGARCHTPIIEPPPPSSACATLSAPANTGWVIAPACSSSRPGRRRAPLTLAPPAAPPRRQSPASPQVGPVPVRAAQRVAGLVAGSRDTGQLHQGSQGISGHR